MAAAGAKGFAFVAWVAAPPATVMPPVAGAPNPPAAKVGEASPPSVLKELSLKVLKSVPSELAPNPLSSALNPPLPDVSAAAVLAAAEAGIVTLGTAPAHFWLNSKMKLL